MRATVLTEVVNQKSGKVLKRFVQPSRSFVEGLMSCLYVAQSINPLTDAKIVGYTGNAAWDGSGVQSLYQYATNHEGLRVSGCDFYRSRFNWYSLTPGAGHDRREHFAPFGIVFGEGDAAASSYDRSLGKPMGISPPVPVGMPSFDTLMGTSAVGHFDSVTDQWYFLDAAVNPNLIRIFDIDGVWQSTVTTAILNTQQAMSCFVEGGFMYALKVDNLWYKINLVTGAVPLTRSIAGDGHGSFPYSCWYDDVAGNIVGIGSLSGGNAKLIRWNLADFTVAVAAANIDFNRTHHKDAVTIWKAYPIDAARQWAVGMGYANRPMLLDVANLIYYQWSGARVQSYPTPFGSGLGSDGWLYVAHTGAAATLMRVFKFYYDFRNLKLLPTYCNLVEADAVSGYFDIVGSMENNTGGDVTVREVGIHALSGAGNSPLIARDVLAAPVVLPTGQVIRTTYRLSASI